MSAHSSSFSFPLFLFFLLLMTIMAAILFLLQVLNIRHSIEDQVHNWIVGQEPYDGRMGCNMKGSRFTDNICCVG